MDFALGQVIVNLGRITCVVVGHWTAADGRACDMNGWPIVREVGPTGRLRGGKWVATPSMCTPAE